VIFYFSHAFYPLVKVLSASTNFINRLIGLKKPESHLTESELRQMIKWLPWKVLSNRTKQHP
jgi:putative hemolysin